MAKMKKIINLIIFLGLVFLGFKIFKITQIKQDLQHKIQFMQNEYLELENTNSRLLREIENLIYTYMNLTQGKESHLLCKMSTDVPRLSKSPKIIKQVMPDAEWLRFARVEGYVYLEVIIDSEGNVIRLRLIRGYPLLNQYAIRAVLQWKFMPVIIDGKATPARFSVRVRFSYDQY